MSKKARPVKPVTRRAPASDPSPAETVTDTAIGTVDPVAEPSTREQLQADRAAAVSALAELKKAEPRDAEAVYAQKLVVHEIAAALAAHDAVAE